MELKKFLEVLRRRKWLALQTFLVVTLTAVIGTFMLTPQYTAWAKFFIKKVENPASSLTSGAPGLTEITSLITPSGDAAISQALATSRPMVEQTVAKLQLRNEIGELWRADELLTSGFLSPLFPKPYIEVTRLPESDILQIWTTSTDPQEAAMIANTLAELMVEESRRETREAHRNAITFIDEQLQSMKVQYDRSLDVLKAFQEREKTVSLGTEKQWAVQKLGELLKQKEDNLIDLAEARAKLETLKRQLGRQEGETVATLALSENPQIRLLKDRLSELELKLTEALADFTEAAPQVKALRQQIALVKGQLAKELRGYQGSALQAEELERQIAALSVHLKGVNEAIDRFLTSFYNTLPGKAAQQARLELSVTANQRVYETLLDYRNQISVAEASVLSNIRVLDPAFVPLEPSSPKKLLNLVVGAFLGMLTALGLVLLREYLDDTLKTPDDIQDEGKLPLLGVIPHFPSRREPSITSLPPVDPVTEAYRSLRNNLRFASPDRPLKSLLITSALSGEGKTTTVANLGISLSREGKKVLLLDGDLRNPGLVTVFKRPALVGLTNVLVEEVELQEAILELEGGLFLLPSGMIPPDPGQVVESTKMRKLIEMLSSRFDVVILDSPPVLSVSDALILGGYVDGVIAILESGRAPRQAATAIKERMEEAKVPLLGVVLNKLPKESFGYYYGYYYSNGHKGWWKVLTRSVKHGLAVDNSWASWTDALRRRVRKR